MTLTLSSDKKEYSVAVFVLPNNDSGISILNSSSEIIDVQLQNNKLEYIVATSGEQRICWDKKNGKPEFESCEDVKFSIVEKEKQFEIKVWVKKDNSKVIIRKSK